MKKSIFVVELNKKIFLEVIENGFISLYNHEYKPNASGLPVTVWFIGKGTETITELKSNGILNDGTRKERKEKLAELLKDNKPAYDLYMAQKKFSFDSILDVVHFYNTGQHIKKPASKADDVY